VAAGRSTIDGSGWWALGRTMIHQSKSAQCDMTYSATFSGLDGGPGVSDPGALAELT
jgi:hypothetical protein